jgi:hypothetical protein
MGIILALFVLGMMAVGFTMLAALPLLFIWLAVGVYTEPWTEATVGGPLTDITPDEPADIDSRPADTETERPRVMVAGRRGRPL